MPKPKAVAKVIVEVNGKRVCASFYPTLWPRQYRILVGGKKARRKPVSTITEAFSELRRWTTNQITE